MAIDSYTHGKVLSLPSGAQWFKADLHIHTPASGNDFRGNGKETTAQDIVEAAIVKGLDIIAVTDHNTVAWCDKVRKAAEGKGLVVFPGVEVSTKEGHVLAIFDVDTQTQEMNRFLEHAGFPPEKVGVVEYSSELGFSDTVDVVAKFGGVAIAAHADRDRGFMKSIATKLEIRRVYESENLWAIEILDTDLRYEHQSGKHISPRRMTCLQFSDSHELGNDMGRRSTYLKMGEKNLDGLKLALLDPYIRVAFSKDELPNPECAILGMWVTNGFLDGQQMRFNEGVNCLIGDTGSGKSLSLELVRFALDQQPVVLKIQQEVESLLNHQLNSAGTIHVLLRKGSSKYLVERTLSRSSSSPNVQRIEDSGRLSPTDISNVREFFPIKCFSQSEIIEFAREKSVRLSLTDDLIAISEELTSIERVKGSLRRNAANIIAEEENEKNLRGQISSRPALTEDLNRVEETLPQERLKEQELWGVEKKMLEDASEQIKCVSGKLSETMSQLILLPDWGDEIEELPNKNSLKKLRNAFKNWQSQVASSQQGLTENLEILIKALQDVRQDWEPRFEDKRVEYRSLLERLDTGGRGLQSLAEYRKDIKEQLARLDESEQELCQRVIPRIAELREERECLLSELQSHRKSITHKRETKARDLTLKLDRDVRLRVHARQDNEQFKKSLSEIAVGARLGTSNIDLLSKAHPVPFVKRMIDNSFGDLADQLKVSVSKLESLWETILERSKLNELYEMQLVDIDDIIEVQLAVEQGEYKDIERLSHGEKCRVVLMVALAEGDFPLLVDQPEDALHAPGIEKGIVSTLRFNRGKRQCIFATRSANILVSADSDQILALEAEAEKGSVKSTGSLDRFDHKTLIIHHVEGGKEAFRRRNSLYTLRQVALE